MNSSLAGFLELSLVFGSLLAFLIWELLAVRREQRRDVEKRSARDSTE